MADRSQIEWTGHLEPDHRLRPDLRRLRPLLRTCPLVTLRSRAASRAAARLFDIALSTTQPGCAAGAEGAKRRGRAGEAGALKTRKLVKKLVTAPTTPACNEVPSDSGARALLDLWLPQRDDYVLWALARRPHPATGCPATTVDPFDRTGRC